MKPIRYSSRVRINFGWRRPPQAASRKCPVGIRRFVQRVARRIQALSPAEPDINLAVDVSPFSRGAQAAHQLFEGFTVLRRIFEPSQEVEGLRQLAAMMESARNLGQVVLTDRDMVGLLLKEGAPLILSQRPGKEFGGYLEVVGGDYDERGLNQHIDQSVEG